MDKDKKIDELIAKMRDDSDEEVYRYADELIKIGGPEVMNKMLKLLYDPDDNIKYLASKILAGIENNQEALEPLLKAIFDKSNDGKNGAMIEALEAFDISDKFVDLFRLFLFGTLKGSAMAKLHLDYTEFDITPRTLRKAKKHWEHFLNNPRNDSSYDIRKEEAEVILAELEELLES